MLFIETFKLFSLVFLSKNVVYIFYVSYYLNIKFFVGYWIMLELCKTSYLYNNLFYAILALLCITGEHK